MAGDTCMSFCGSERKRHGAAEPHTDGKCRGGTYVPGMYRKRSSNDCRSGIHGRNSGGVHRQIQEVLLGERAQSISENQGEIRWQQPTRKISSSKKCVSQ